MNVAEQLEDLFRRESGRLVAALVRVLGPSHLALAEDVVHDALVSAMQAWRFGAPADPTAWLLHVARNRAIDHLRRDRRLEPLEGDAEVAVDLALSAEADAANQLAMMFAICDDALSPETHVTLILRLMCGLSTAEIARAFLVDPPTIDRRLHRGRVRLQTLGVLPEVTHVRARQPSVEQALYLLFNEGYHGNGADSPLSPAMCGDALRLAELLLAADDMEPTTTHALAALFCFDAARLATRLDEEGVLVPLAEQDRAQWDRSLLHRGIQHLGASASGDRLTRFHIEAGIAYEHTSAPSVVETKWARIVDYYDALLVLTPGPVVALNRALAVAELRGVDAGRKALLPLSEDSRLVGYSFYWAARADLERRAGNAVEARTLYDRAITLASNDAERASYARRVNGLAIGDRDQ